jgi:uncharacterized protein (DUF2336 family)
MSFFDKFLPGKPQTYDEQRAALKSADVKARLSLAKNSKTNREILYYLAEKDPEAKVRKAVINNKAMPVQASPVLASDKDQDVRLALAGRLVELLPDLSQDKQSQLYAFAVQALGTLALDEVLKIRIALSSTLKDHAQTPPKVAGQLARDVEREVSEPVLRFCAALSDIDLLDILKSHPATWVIEAIAQRKAVSELVAGAVIETRNPPGGRALIENEGASLGEQLLHTIVEMARKLPEWQKPMAVRKSLPISIAKELAEFVDASVRDLLLKRGDFDENTTEEIAAVFRRRVDFASSGHSKEEGDDVGERIRRLVKEGNLNEDTLSDALAMRDREFVMAAVAAMAKTDYLTIKKVFDMQSPKPIVALCWKASLSMRMALQLQKEIGRVDPKQLLYPKGGTDYPLSEKDLNWQLEFLGLKSK